MALGDFQLFSWKSKETLKKEQEVYEKWAFPYGTQQRENLEKLMREVCPKEQLPFLMMGFLTCKELFEKILEGVESEAQVVDRLINKEKKYKNVISKREMTRYVAFVLADRKIDESCQYPSADEMREHIQALDNMKEDKKGK
ncbi:MAG: hypothetical protein FWC75_05845 [Oscillospiraceae bacterium]|nr:hypothetical protein [Oscillospiraceae bacterium]